MVDWPLVLPNRIHHCLQTLFLLFQFITSETKRHFVTTTSTLLVGTVMISDVSVSITNRSVIITSLSKDLNKRRKTNLVDSWIF